MYTSQLQQQLPVERYREHAHNAYLLRTQDSLGFIAKKIVNCNSFTHETLKSSYINVSCVPDQIWFWKWFPRRGELKPEYGEN